MSRIKGNIEEKLERERARIRIGEEVKTRTRRFVFRSTEGMHNTGIFNKCKICAFRFQAMCFKYHCFYNNNGTPVSGIFMKVEE